MNLSHGIRNHPRTTGNWRHLSTEVPKKDTSPGHSGHPTSQKMRIKGDTWIIPTTHRLLPLGITSPFDLPEDSLDILNLLLFVLYRRIHILSVNSLYFQVFFGTPESTLRATRITGKLDQFVESLARRIRWIGLQPRYPFLVREKGRPRTCTSSIFGTYQGEPPRTKRFKERTGGPDTTNSQHSPV